MKNIGQTMLKGCTLTLLGLAVSLLIAQTVLATESLSDEWTFSGAIYGWMPAIKGQTTTGKDVDVSFSDIVNNLDFTFMGGLSARKDKLSLLIDVIYMNVEDTSNSTLFQDNLLKLSLTNVQLKSWIVTPMVAYNVLESDRLKLDLLAGARYLYLKVDSDFEGQLGPLTRDFSPSGSTDFWDGIVGLIGNVKLNEKWYLPYHGDIGGGDTDLTWQVFGGVGYKFDNFDLVAGYRHLEWDFDSSDKGGKLLNDLYISGPMVGLRYSF